MEIVDRFSIIQKQEEVSMNCIEESLTVHKYVASRGQRERVCSSMIFEKIKANVILLKKKAEQLEI